MIIGTGHNKNGEHNSNSSDDRNCYWQTPCLQRGDCLECNKRFDERGALLQEASLCEAELKRILNGLGVDGNQEAELDK